MSIKQELKALGAADDYCKYVEQLTKQDFTLADLVLPLVLQLGHARAEHRRLFAKHLQQVRELDAKNRRIANLTKEKLAWESTNHHKNKYIEELKGYVQNLSKEQNNAWTEVSRIKRSYADREAVQAQQLEKDRQEVAEAYKKLLDAKLAAEKETARVTHAYNDLKAATTFVARYTPGPELQAAYYAQRDMSMGCKVPEPEQPYVPFRDKTAWAIGDRVRIDAHLKGAVRHISCSSRSGVHTIGILTGSTGAVETTHWLGRKRQGGDIEYLNQYTQVAK